MLQTSIVPAFSTFPPDGLGDMVLFGGLKLLFIVFFALYTVFSFVVIRQVSLMRNTIETPIDPLLMFGSWIFFASSIVVLLLAIFTL